MSLLRSLLLACLLALPARAQTEEAPSLPGTWSGAFALSAGSGVSGAAGSGLLVASPQALAVHPLTGETYVAGQNLEAGRSALLRWTGSDWAAVTPAIDGLADIRALAFAPDGTLYLAGSFLDLGGVAEADYVARWDGSALSGLGQGLDGTARVLHVAPDGTLYVGGLSSSFSGGTDAGGAFVASRSVIAWTGTRWQALGQGLAGGRFSDVYALTSDPATGDLIVTGDLFDGVVDADGTTIGVGNVGRWDGAAWSRVGNANFNYDVYAAAYLGQTLYIVHEGLSGADGTLHRLTAAGTFERVAAFEGDDPTALAVRDGRLYVGGGFRTVRPDDGPQAGREWQLWGVGAYEPATGRWSALGGGLRGASGEAPTVRALAWNGAALWSAGEFGFAGGRLSLNVGRWDAEPGYAGVYATLRLDASRQLRTGLLDGYTLFAQVAGGPAAGRYALLPPARTASSDSLVTARVFVPRSTRTRYGFGATLNPLALDPSAPIDAPVFTEQDGPAGRAVTLDQPAALPIALLDDAPAIGVAPDPDQEITLWAEAGEEFPSVFPQVQPRIGQAPRDVLLSVRLYRDAPGGAPPAGFAGVQQNGYWTIDGLPAREPMRLAFSYASFAGITAPADLRLVRRLAPGAAWTPVETAFDGAAQTLTVDVQDVRGQWAFASTTDRNPMSDALPGLVSNPNPASGALSAPERPRLEWAPAAFALDYDVYVWPDGQSRPATPTRTVAANALTLTSALTRGVRYNWQVVARNANGETPGPVWTFTTGAAANLVVSAVEAPAEGFGRTEIEVAWTVTNAGDGATRAGSWTDALYLSRDDVISSDDAFLGRFANPAALAPGETYRQSERVEIPVSVRRLGGGNIRVREEDAVEGAYRLIVRADDRSRETESDEADNEADRAFTARLPNLPDLRVTSVADPVAYCYVPPPPPPIAVSFSKPAGTEPTDTPCFPAFGGGQYCPCPDAAQADAQTLRPDLLYSFTITGVNEGAAPARDFGHRLYFQGTPTLSALSALPIGYATPVDEVDPGETYTARTSPFQIRDEIERSDLAVPDTGYVYVVVDADQNVFEGAFRDDNTFRFDEQTILRPLPPSDVEMAALSVTDAIAAGDTLAVAFDVRNIGPAGVPLAAVDYAVYLEDAGVAPDAFDPDSARVLARSFVSALEPSPLEPDETRAAALEVVLPEGLTGDFRLYVQLDPQGLLNEFVNDVRYLGNNVASRPLTITPSDAPDLTPLSLDAPATAVQGQTVVIGYEVRNAGSGALGAPRTQRTDALYLAAPGGFPGAEQARLLRRMGEREPVAPGDSYARSVSLTVPQDVAPGSYGLYLVADADSARFEADESNNVREAALTLTERPRPDLVPAWAAAPPATAATGEVLSLAWTVRNDGARATAATSWTDAVVVSADDRLSADDRVIGRQVRIGALAAGASYAQTLEVTLPADLTGEATLFLVADRTGEVDESAAGRAGNAVPSALSVALSEPADLRVAGVTITGTPQAGQPLRAVVEVVNDGAAIPARTRWTDTWTLSPGTERTSETVALLSQTRSGPLAAGASYTHTVDLFLPEFASGSYQLATTADARRQVTEAGRRANNVDARTIEIVLPPPVDLVAENVVVPQGAQPGEEITVTYEIVNRGQQAFAGLFFDAVHLSPDPDLDAGDPRLAFVRRSLTLAPGARTQAALRVRLPRLGEAIVAQHAAEPASPLLRGQAGAQALIGGGGPALGEAPSTLAALRGSQASDATGTVPNLVPGQYHAVVAVDVRRGVRETDNANNTAASGSRIGLDVEAMQVGVPEPVDLTAGLERYFKLDVPAGRDLRLTLENATDLRDEEFEVYVAFGRVPSPGDFDAAFFADTDESAPVAFVPQTQAGTYYVLARNPYLRGDETADVTLLAEAFDFGLLGTTPDAGGTQGRVVATVTGAQLSDQTTFYLEDGATRIAGEVMQVVSSMAVEVRFDLRGQPLGTYDVVAEQGGAQARLADAFEVQTPSLRSLRRTLLRPTALLINDRAALELVVTNDGNADLDVVTVNVLVPGDQFVRATSERMVSGFLVPEGSAEVPQTIDAGSPFGIRTAQGEELELGLLSFIGRDLRVGESMTIEIVTPQLLADPGDVMPYGYSGVGYAAGEFAQMVRDKAPVTLAALAEHADRVFADNEDARQALLATRAEVERAFTDGLDAWLESVGLGEGGTLRGASTVTYTPPTDAEVLAAVATGAYHDAALSATGNPNVNCGTVSAAVGLGLAITVGIPALAVSFAALPAVVTGAAAAAFFFTTAAATFSFILTVDALVNGTDWEAGLGPLLGGFVGRFGLPTSPLDLIPGGAQLICEGVVGAIDPNDILGPEGYGEARWVPAAEPLAYTIRFENDPEFANAPAKEVVVTQTLDDDLDLRTLRVERFGWGDYAFELPGSGRAFYRDRLDLRDSLDAFVDVTTSLDVATRELRLVLRAVDPLTGDLLRDPLGGFLPPNLAPPEGDGFFAYRITPRADAPTGARIDAQARIVFDSNAPIDTPPIFNTLDAARPDGRVADVTVLDSLAVRVALSRSDEGSGATEVGLYGRARPDVAASARPGQAAQAPFVLLATTTDSVLVFERPAGAAYEFFARAVDGAGNAEQIQTQAEGATFVSDEAPAAPLAFALLPAYPNPARDRATLPFELPAAGAVAVEVFDLLGRRVLRLDAGAQPAGRRTLALDLSGLAAGVYFYALEADDGQERHRATGQLVRVR